MKDELRAAVERSISDLETSIDCHIETRHAISKEELSEIIDNLREALAAQESALAAARTEGAAKMREATIKEMREHIASICHLDSMYEACEQIGEVIGFVEQLDPTTVAESPGVTLYTDEDVRRAKIEVLRSSISCPYCEDSEPNQLSGGTWIHCDIDDAECCDQHLHNMIAALEREGGSDEQ